MIFVLCKKEILRKNKAIMIRLFFLWACLFFTFSIPQQSQALYSKSEFLSIEEQAPPVERKKRIRKQKKLRLKKRRQPKQSLQVHDASGTTIIIFTAILNPLLGSTLGTVFISLASLAILSNVFLIVGLVLLSISLSIISIAFGFSRAGDGIWISALLMNLIVSGIIGLFLLIAGLLWSIPLLWIIGIVFLVQAVLFIVINSILGYPRSYVQ